MSETVDQLLAILHLEEIDRDLFRGQNEVRPWPRLFGGQVLAQALQAGRKTVEADRPCHSMHGYFMRPGSDKRPVVYQVERIRDGRSFTTRRIKAIQNGEAIFSMDASYQVVEQGLTHQIDMGDFPMPDELEDDTVTAGRVPQSPQMSGWATRERPFDMRSVYPLDQARPDTFDNPVWLRFRREIPIDDSIHQSILGYASDMGLVSTSYIPHRHTIDREHIQSASLDHAMWFHQAFDVSDWILYLKDTTAAGGSRGFNRGSFFSAEGKLIASAMQEGLIRQRGDGGN